MMVGASVFPVAGDETARLVRTYSGVTQGPSVYVCFNSLPLFSSISNMRILNLKADTI